MRPVTILAALALMLSACASTGAVDEQVERVDEVNIRVDAIGERLASIEASLGTLNLPPDLSGEIANLNDEVSGLNREVRGLRQTADTAYYEAVSEVDDLRDCVNEYMDTIGRWSTNVNSYYDYFYC